MKEKKNYQIPYYERPKAYNFNTTPESYAIYEELNAIAEEIEKCRLRNS